MPTTGVTVAEANGVSAPVTYAAEQLVAVASFELRDGATAQVRIVVNPDELLFADPAVRRHGPRGVTRR